MKIDLVTTVIHRTLNYISMTFLLILTLDSKFVSPNPSLYSPHSSKQPITSNPFRMPPNMYNFPRTSPPSYADDFDKNYSPLRSGKLSQLFQRGTQHTFKSSICYDINGKANIGLKCPNGYNIQTVVAFTALSRTAACSYDVWDCILQEGVTQRCDGRNHCSIAASYEESLEALMLCGSQRQHDLPTDRSMYFQVEYECIADNGVKAVALQPETSTTFILLNLEDVVKMNDTSNHDFNDTESAVNDKTALVAILGGSTLAAVILLAVISSCIYRIKTRASKLDGCRSSRITSGMSSMCTDTIHTDPDLMRQPRRNFQYDYRRQLDRPQQFGRGFTIWNGRSTTYVENENAK